MLHNFNYFLQLIFRLLPLTSAPESNQKIVNQPYAALFESWMPLVHHISTTGPILSSEFINFFINFFKIEIKINVYLTKKDNLQPFNK